MNAGRRKATVSTRFPSFPRVNRLPDAPPPCKLVIAVWSDQKELDKPSRNFILILQMKMETCLLKSRQLCQQAGLRQQEK